MTSLDELVVIVAGTTWEAGRLSEQHVAERLARRVPVLYVDPPSSPRSARHDPRLATARQQPRLRQFDDQLYRLTPHVVPGRNRAVARHVVDALVRRQLRQAVDTLAPRRVPALVAVPDRPLFGTCHEERRVHWVKDDYVAGARLVRQSARVRRRRREVMARQADAVVVASPVLADRWAALGADPVVIPPGCDIERLRLDVHREPSPFATDGPVAGIVGTLSSRLDRELVDAVAATGIPLLLVGRVAPDLDRSWFDQLVGRPNVRWIGPVGYERVPAVYGWLDLCLVPYTRTPFNEASFPLKLLEGLAAGCAVLATALPAVRALDTDLVAVADTPAAFADAARRLLRHPSTTEVGRRRAFAAEHSWDERVHRFGEVLGISAAVGGRDAR